MPRRSAVLTALAVLAFLDVTRAPAQQPAADSLSVALRARIATERSAVIGVYFRDLVGGDSLANDADLRFHAASTMTVPVMIQVFRDADAGMLRLDARTSVHNAFRSLADGSTFTLDATDDSDSSLYRQVGHEVRVRELVRLMITRSSNLATNVLIEGVGAERVQASMRGLGADSMRVLRGVEDGAAYRAGLNNTTTARALGTIFAALANGEAASAAACGAMLDILSDTEDRAGIPAGLPPRTRVAHKTGEITAVRHDGGVVFVRGRPRYVLVILTRGIGDVAVANRLLADVARLVHGHATSR